MNAKPRLIVRRADAADLPAIVAMLADDMLGKSRDDASLPLDPVYEQAFLDIDGDPRQFLAVATLDGDVVGTLQLTFIPGLSQKGMWRGLVEAVRICADRRGQGFGRELMIWAISECRARGCRVVQLATNKQRTDAHRFYEKLGFTGSHCGYKLSI